MQADVICYDGLEFSCSTIHWFRPSRVVETCATERAGLRLGLFEIALAVLAHRAEQRDDDARADG